MMITRANQTSRPLRILHCPTTVGGNPQGLSRAERRIGLDSQSVTLVQNYLAYPVDEVLFRGAPIPNEIRRWLFALSAMRRYDVLHYNFGSTLLPHHLDARLARACGKVVCVTYQGDDARQGSFCRSHYSTHFAHEVESSYYSDASDLRKRKSIAFFDCHADHIYALNPDLLNVLPRRAKFVPYAHVDLEDWKPIYPAEAPAAPHIVHAPSHRRVKGTAHVVAAFERLKQEGVEFRFTLVEGVSNASARAVYETADLLVDQLLAGWYGGLSVELMSLGKPVVCYLRDEDLRFIPKTMRSELPLINATPASIYDVLRELLTTRKHELRGRGVASRTYVERWHDPIKIAAQLKEDYVASVLKRHAD